MLGLAIGIPAMSALQNATTVSSVGGNTSTRSVVVADLDGDGSPDLVVANDATNETNQIFWGDGAGGFLPPVDLDGSTERSDSVDVADVDGDSDLDILIGNRSTAANRLYRNNGARSFSFLDQNALSTVMTSRHTSDANFVDVNGDGDPDVVVTNRGSGNMVFIGGAMAGFSVNGTLNGSASTDSSSSAIGRFTNDSSPDLIIGNRENQRNDLYVNNGSAAGFPFDTRRDLSPDANYTDWVAAADLNNDGWDDVIIGNREQPNQYMLNNQSNDNNNLFFPARQISPDADYTREIRVIDIDHDGDLDIIAANNESSKNKLYLNLFIESGSTSVSFSDAIELPGSPDASTSISICGPDSDVDPTCDLDGDGDNDIIFGNYLSPNRIYTNNNEIPEIVSLPVTGAVVGEAYSYTVIATDTDFGQALTISSAGNLNGFTLTPDGSDPRRATLAGTPGAPGALDFSLIVNDGTDDSAPHEFTVNVVASNAAPVFTSAAPPTTFAEKGDASFNHLLTASDAEDAPAALVYSAPVKPGWMTVTDNGNGTATLGGAPGQHDIGNYALVVRVTDTGGRIAEQSVMLTITDGNDKPIAGTDLICLTSAGETRTILGTPTLHPYYGVNNLLWNDSDPDGDTLSFVTGQITQGPNAGTVDIQTDGTFSYTHDGSAATSDSFRYQITDNVGGGEVRFDRGLVEVRFVTDPMCQNAGVNNPPVITVTPTTVEIMMGDTWDDAAALAGVTATDAQDGDITANIVIGGDVVDVNAAGDYVVTYDVTDSGGLHPLVPANRTVTVLDTEAPVITVSPLVVSIAVGSTWDDAAARNGVAATDNVDDDAALTAAIVVGGDTVDTATVGTYFVTYNVSDDAGNAAVEVSRTVNVETNPDTVAPVITITGANPASVVVGGTYTDAGATAMDDVDGDITADIVTTDDVDETTVGAYTVTYTVADSAGNETTATRTVNVTAAADTTPPVITLIGSASMSLTVGNTYNEPGATATDDVDGDISANIVIGGSVNTAAAGTYTVTYDVSDSSGNDATQVTRTVTVTAVVTPPPPSGGGGGGGATSIPELLGLMLLFMVVMSGRRLRLHRRST
ncbi:MAG TPA: DUF5011 domain-containing protein [Woeseiaceae bacterium]|nr:DUF5011 domain-containing protein [Woeseiaceae bacterium]